MTEASSLFLLTVVCDQGVRPTHLLTFSFPRIWVCRWLEPETTSHLHRMSRYNFKLYLGKGEGKIFSVLN